MKEITTVIVPVCDEGATIERYGYFGWKLLEILSESNTYRSFTKSNKKQKILIKFSRDSQISGFYHLSRYEKRFRILERYLLRNQRFAQQANWYIVSAAILAFFACPLFLINKWVGILVGVIGIVGLVIFIVLKIQARHREMNLLNHMGEILTAADQIREK